MNYTYAYSTAVSTGAIINKFLGNSLNHRRQAINISFNLLDLIEGFLDSAIYELLGEDIVYIIQAQMEMEIKAN